jgi:hypothetical protein
LSLPDIEGRHRKTLAALIAALVSSACQPTSQVQALLLDEAIEKSGLEAAEVDTLKLAVVLRVGCRAVEDGMELSVKKMVEEFERRE